MNAKQSNKRLSREPGMKIDYYVSATPLGQLLVAGTNQGVSAVYLGDAGAPLETTLRRQYPQAQIRRNAASVERWMRPLVKHLSGGGAKAALPLDLRATPFERQVWSELQKIPSGTVRSYSEISRRIGRPRAARAVANACAKNPISILIPCHRVVREDGSLGGYRWGMARKRALLEQESAERKSRGR